MAEAKKKTKAGKGTDKIDPVFEELANRIFGYHPDYLPLLIKEMFTLEEAKIAAALPAPVEEVAEKLNLDKAHVEKTINRLVMKGCLIKTVKDIRFPWLQEHYGDIMCANSFYDHERSPEFWRLLSKWIMDEKANEEAAKIFFGMGANQAANAGVRVVPRWKAIKDIPGVMPCEDVRELLRESEKVQKLNVSRCACRTSHLAPTCPVDEGEVPWEGNCIHVGGMAKYHTEVLKCTPYLTAEYILEKLDKMEKVPFYHQTNNSRVIGSLCNCCACDCHIRPMDKLARTQYNVRIVKPSRFGCFVDNNKCTAKAGCNACISLCPFEALRIEDGTVKVDADLCHGCGVCVLNCPDKALQLKIVRPPEHIPEGGDIDLLYRVFTTPLS